MINDPLGIAVQDFQRTKQHKEIYIKSDIGPEEIMPISYLFRKHYQMPILEKKALSLCKGIVLDVGAGAGAHSIWLQKNGFQVIANEISNGCVKFLNQNKIKTINQDIKKIEDIKVDTILLLMNGIGLAEQLNSLPNFLLHLKNLLNPNGQILLESTDISYMFNEDDGSIKLNLKKKYFGELNYQMKYENMKGPKFKWLFVDFDTLKVITEKISLKIEMIYKGKSSQYLAKITEK
jgi:2-polyprenyl-3-methyl-5-hydroxy-6-metoxy-1,4-benzoquinol methylase